ncbi:hypothetical protein PMAYCL1PPCAC_19209, partial [Pristionchus mayeri]
TFLLLLGIVVVAAAVGKAATTNNDKVSSSIEEVPKIVSEQNVTHAKKLKIALFAPYLANSQVLWNKRVGINEGRP